MVAFAIDRFFRLSENGVRCDAEGIHVGRRLCSRGPPLDVGQSGRGTRSKASSPPFTVGRSILLTNRRVWRLRPALSIVATRHHYGFLKFEGRRRSEPYAPEGRGRLHFVGQIAAGLEAMRKNWSSQTSWRPMQRRRRRRYRGFLPEVAERGTRSSLPRARAERRHPVEARETAPLAEARASLAPCVPRRRTRDRSVVRRHDPDVRLRAAPLSGDLAPSWRRRLRTRSSPPFDEETMAQARRARTPLAPRPTLPETGDDALWSDSRTPGSD